MCVVCVLCTSFSTGGHAGIKSDQSEETFGFSNVTMTLNATECFPRLEALKLQATRWHRTGMTGNPGDRFQKRQRPLQVPSAFRWREQRQRIKSWEIKSSAGSFSLFFQRNIRETLRKPAVRRTTGSSFRAPPTYPPPC